MIYLKLLKKQEQPRPNLTNRKRKTQYKEPMKKNWFFKMKNIIDKHLDKPSKRRKIPKLIKVGMKKGTSQQMPIKSRGSLGSLYFNKLEEMDKF
jgi:hypothetical protein